MVDAPRERLGWALGLSAAWVGALAFTTVVPALDSASVRLFIRTGARTSYVLFVLVLIASALFTLAPSPTTRWLLAQRRALGLALAVVHLSVGTAILTLAAHHRDTFFAVTYPLQRIGGAFGYLVLVVLVITSLHVVKRRMNPGRWKAIHRFGIIVLFVNFSVSYGRRVFVARDPFFVPFLATLVAAAVVRMLARRRPAARALRDVTAAARD